MHVPLPCKLDDMKKRVAIIAGGNSGEYEVSINSAKMVLSVTDPNLYEAYIVIIKGNSWYVEYENQQLSIDKSDFSFQLNNTKQHFDVVYNIIHGTPGEDGIIQGYFELMGIPLVGPDILNCALTMNKLVSKKLAVAFDIPVAKAVTKHKHESIDYDAITSITGYPCFLKPNNGGSSVATYKIKEKAQFPAALADVFKHDHTAIFEEFIEGVEVACGVFEKNGELICLPITEIVPHNEFFDYAAKYEGASTEITPARLPEATHKRLNELTKKLYRILECKGMVRIDFIVKGETPYFLEANTIPGFSPASIIPQQIRAAGMTEKEVITYLIEEKLKQYAK